MPTNIDHLVIGAADLSQGAAYVKECLGVDIPYGGVHVSMGTHNCLMRLGESVFLEVMAINPDIEPPQRPRWFGLNDPYVRRQIEARPTLLTWVVNTTNIQDFLQRAKFPFGHAELMSRGDLSWRFGLPNDGGILAGGMLPYVIEWQTDSHPAARYADVGCQLQTLEIYHPYPSWLHAILESIDADNLVKIYPLPPNSEPYLMASFNTPNGVKKLRSGSSAH